MRCPFDNNKREISEIRGALYTGYFKMGDFNTAQEIKSYYTKEENKIKAMYIPHHGSEKYLTYRSFDNVKQVLLNRINSWNINQQIWN